MNMRQVLVTSSPVLKRIHSGFVNDQVVSMRNEPSQNRLQQTFHGSIDDIDRGRIYE